MSDVIQSDRDAAAAVVLAIGFTRNAAQDILDGEKDYTPIVQAFASHRLASSADLRAKLDVAREALRTADEALCSYACHGGPTTPCARSPDQCRSECGKEAGDALMCVREALATIGDGK